jgi:hypothetical protein
MNASDWKKNWWRLTSNLPSMRICKNVGTYEIDENVTFNVELDLCMIYTLCCRHYSRQPSRFTKSGKKSVKKPHIILTIRSTTFLRWKILETFRAQKPMTETAREHPRFQNGHNYLTNISKSPTVIGLLMLTPNWPFLALLLCYCYTKTVINLEQKLCTMHWYMNVFIFYDISKTIL